jgi:hypothetical protein
VERWAAKPIKKSRIVEEVSTLIPSNTMHKDFTGDQKFTNKMTFNDLLCIPVYLNPSVILHFERSLFNGLSACEIFICNCEGFAYVSNIFLSASLDRTISIVVKRDGYRIFGLKLFPLFCDIYSPKSCYCYLEEFGD